MDETQVSNNDEVQNDVADVQVEETQPVEETTEVVETTEPTQSVTTETVVEPEEDDDEGYAPMSLNTPQDAQSPQLDLSQIPLDADGNLDAGSLAKAINDQLAAANQEARQAKQFVLEVEEKRREEQLWSKAQDKYPELKDKQLAEEVNALRFGMLMTEVTSGKADAKLITPAKAFERLRTRFQAERSAGVQSAIESVKVQESAYVEPNQNAQASDSASEDALFQKMRYADRVTAESAQRELLKKRLFGN